MEALVMRTAERGVALLVVLWACTLLAILVGGFASITRTEALQTRFTLGQQRARYAAEAAIMQAIATMDAQRMHRVANAFASDGDLPGDGRPVPFEFAGMHVSISMVDESGKVDINTADKPVLQALFLAAGCGADRAERLATNVVEWRSVVAGASGDEASRYAAAGLPYRPRHAEFAAIEELQGVLGMDAPTFAAVEPVITVWSGGTRPQAGFAPALALAALPGMDLAKARAVVAMRDAAPPNTRLLGLPTGISIGRTKPSSATTFRAVADDGHGMRATIEATVKFSRQGETRNWREPLYTILRWRDGASG
jgi:general secretion pathway protein K